MRLRPTCVSLIAIVLFFTLVNAIAPVVDESYSKYRSKGLGHGVTHWLGMRYAAPPLVISDSCLPKTQSGVVRQGTQIKGAIPFR